MASHRAFQPHRGVIHFIATHIFSIAPVFAAQRGFICFCESNFCLILKTILSNIPPRRLLTGSLREEIIQNLIQNYTEYNNSRINLFTKSIKHILLYHFHDWHMSFSHKKMKEILPARGIYTYRNIFDICYVSHLNTPGKHLRKQFTPEFLR